jgi:glyoxylase-like metal-dependent hydrolase (beta-lactamase superfamily II)
MLKTILIISSVIFSLSLNAQDFDAVEIETIDIGDGIYMLVGMGGNIGVSVGEDGVFVIDTQFAPLSEKILNAIAKISDQPVSYIVNTHWHGDHTGGNAGVSAGNALIMAHENVRIRMTAAESEASALPVITFNDTSTYHINGHEIHATHPQPAHTDGDAYIYFSDIDILHTGDLLFNGIYPFIDLNSGGSVSGYIKAQEQMLEIIGPDTRIIPGHGPLATREDMENTVAMLKDIHARISGLVEQGNTLEQIQAENPLADYNETYNWNVITSERMTEIIYNDVAH